MRYFNNPQTVGQLKAEYDQILEELAKKSITSDDTVDFQKEYQALNKEYDMWLKKLREENTIKKDIISTYFKNPQTLEELDNQYRVYIRKLSNQKGGDKILEQINKEYERLKKDIKYNNGQLTLTQKIHRGIIEINETRAYRAELEEEKKWSYLNKTYTKEDMQNLVLRQKQIIQKAINIYVKKGIVLNCDIANANNASVMKIIRDCFICVAKLDEQYNELMKEKDYILEALSLQNNIPLEKYKLQMEQIICEYTRKTYLELEEKYADPIKTYDRNKRLKEVEKSNHFARTFNKIMICMGIFTIILVVFMFLTL